MRATVASSASDAATGQRSPPWGCSSTSSDDRSGGGGVTTNSRSRAPQAHVDRAGRKLARDLLGGRGQGVLDGETDGGVEGSGQAFRDGPGLVAPGLGGDQQLPADGLDEPFQIHGIIMAP